MRTLSVLAIASVLFIAPVLLATNNNVFAQNSVTQGIGQLQLATQLGICLSGVNTFISCNNLSNQEQTNFGNNVAGQQGGSGYKGDGGNTATQGIGQAQSIKQGAVCVSGDGTFASCNNLSNQEQTNFGNNVAGQQGGSGYKGDGGNTATQGIGQGQSATQGSLCVSGGSTSASCNNLSNQEQTNFGNNVAGQQGGSGSGSGGGNTATQGIGQGQSATQRSLCVSGDDTSGSCNNLSNQEQTNFGNNVAGQQGGSGSGSGSGGGNTATQGIGQGQSATQGSLCVSGGSTSGSCNNLNSQTQTNYGNNVIGQTR